MRHDHEFTPAPVTVRPAEPASTRGQTIAGVALGLGLLGLGVWTLQGFLPALAWAVIFAIATWPLYRRMVRRFPPGRHNLLLPTLFTLAVALLFIVPLALGGVRLAHEAQVVAQWMREVQRNGLPVPDALNHLPYGGPQATEWWNRRLARPGGMSELLGRISSAELMLYSRQLGSQLFHRLVLFGFTLLTLFFLFRDGESLTAEMVRASHRLFGPRGERIGRQIVASVHGTVDGLVLVGLGQGAVMGVVYAAAGVPHAPLFGAATAVAAMIPFGAFIAFTVAALLLVAQGAVAWGVAVVAIGLLVVFLADHLVRPVLIGGATKLPFVWVLFGILGGVEVWGLLGLFLGPAIMAALILLWRELAEGEPAA